MHVIKGTKVSHLNADETISKGKVVGIGYAKYYQDDVSMSLTAQVVFEDYQGAGTYDPCQDGWFIEMYARDLNSVDHVYDAQCECGSLFRMCHPDA